MLIRDRVNVSTNRKYTDEGFLIVQATIARTGIQEYRAFELGLQDKDPADIIRVYRPPEEVFSEDSLSSFANKILTDDHPSVLVDATNAKELSVGHSGPEITKDGIFVSAVLHFTDAKAIKNVEDGKVELSNGYTSDMDMVPGVTPDGDSYDAIQRNIKGNHIALVDKGRCGPACKVSDNSPKPKEPNMAKITIDGVDFEVDDQAAQAVRKLQGRLSDAEEKTKEDEEKAKKKEDDEEAKEKDNKTKMDTLQAKLDDAVAKQPTPAQLDALVENRIATRDAAVKINNDFKWEGKDCETIRKEIVADACSDVDIESVSADYIRARFDSLASDPKVTMSARHIDSALQLQNGKGPSNENKNTVTDARADFAKKSRDAWKGDKS